MEPFEVWPKLEQEYDNPYRALVKYSAEDVSDDFSGEIRITPPVILYENMLVLLSGDVGVTVENYISGNEATILRFYIDEIDDDDLNDGLKFGMTKEGRLEYTVKSLIHELGRLSNAELFLHPNTDLE